jgi:hypothetical protein
MFSAIARNRSDAHLAKISAALTGKKVSDQHRLSIRAALGSSVEAIGGSKFQTIVDALD